MTTLAIDPYSPRVVSDAWGITDPNVLDFRTSADTVICSSLTDKTHSRLQAMDGQQTAINALDVSPGVISREINGERGIAVQAAEAPIMRKVLATMSWTPSRPEGFGSYTCVFRVRYRSQETDTVCQAL